MSYGFNWEIFVGTIHRSKEAVLKAYVFRIHGNTLHIIELKRGLNLYKKYILNIIYIYCCLLTLLTPLWLVRAINKKSRSKIIVCPSFRLKRSNKNNKMSVLYLFGSMRLLIANFLADFDILNAYLLFKTSK